MRAAKSEPWLVYDGKLAELYRIFVPTLLLSIVTLGIYRFWGKTRIRRYLWAHTSFQGDRFVYTGTGGELFRGFLFAALLLFGLGLLNILFSLVLLASYPKLRPVTGVPFLIVILILADAARFSAQRYRLSRTTWRGIRGGMQGSALRYGLHALGTRALTAVTLFQYLPWARINLAWDRINASSFGNVPFWFEGSGRRLYGRWLLTCLGWVALLALFLATLFACSRVVPHPLHPQDRPALVAVIAIAALVAVLGLLRLR